MALPLRNLIIGTCLFWVATLRGTTVAPTTAHTEPVFQLYCIGTNVDMLYNYQGKKRQAYAGQTMFSEPLPVPSNRLLNFYREDPPEKPDEPPIHVPEATATIPAGRGPFLVLLAPSSTGAALPLASRVVDYSLKAHPAGTFRVFSFSKRKIAVKLGSITAELTPGESLLIPYPDSTSTWLQVAVADETGWHPVVGSIQGVSAGSRTSLFLCDVITAAGEEPGKGLLVRKIKDIPPAADEEARPSSPTTIAHR
jgi:hypothetical protein